MTEIPDIKLVKVVYLHYAQATSTINRCAECKKPYPCPTIEAIK